LRYCTERIVLHMCRWPIGERPEPWRSERVVSMIWTTHVNSSDVMHSTSERTGIVWLWTRMTNGFRPSDGWSVSVLRPEIAGNTTENNHHVDLDPSHASSGTVRCNGIRSGFMNGDSWNRRTLPKRNVIPQQHQDGLGHSMNALKLHLLWRVMIVFRTVFGRLSDILSLSELLALPARTQNRSLAIPYRAISKGTEMDFSR
jgi:hypothetical protein